MVEGHLVRQCNLSGYAKLVLMHLSVRLQTGALAVFSPTALTPEVKEKVSSLGGNVKYIVAPDLEVRNMIALESTLCPAC